MKIIVLSSNTESLFWNRTDMMRDFISAGHKVIAVGEECEEEWNAKFVIYGIEYRQIYVSRNGLNPLSDIRTFFEIKSILNKLKPERVFVYQAKTIVYGCLAAKFLNIHEVYPLIAGLGSIFRGRGLKNELIKTVLKVQYWLAFKCSQRVIFHNHDDLNELVSLGLLSLKKAEIVNGSGVNLDSFIPSSYPETPVFLFIGRLIRDKGVSEYLEACRFIKQKYNDVRCLLIGPFDTNPSALKPEELQSYIDNNVIEYLGEQLDVRPFISMCSTFVLPSYHEGTPKTVLESMAMGRAIITSDAPGCKETVVNGKNGFLVKVRDISALILKMEYMILHPDVNREMGAFSIQIAREKYDTKKVNKAIMKIMKL